MEVQLTSDELGAVMCRGKACETRTEHLLDFTIDKDLLSLVQFEVTEGTFALTCVTPCL